MMGCNMLSAVAIVILVSFTDRVASKDAYTCYAENNVTHNQMAHGLSTWNGTCGNNTFKSPNCTVVQIWMYSTTGIPFPEKEVIEGMKNLPKLCNRIVENFEKKNSSLCQKDVNNLKNWILNAGINNSNAENFTAQDEEEHKLRAECLKNLYPEFLNSTKNKLTPKNYTFGSTDAQRANASKYSFFKGLFGNESIKLEDALKPDYSLKPYENCNGWSDSNKIGIRMQKTLTESPEFQNLTKNINLRLNITDITLRNITTMWQMCKIDMSFDRKKQSPWCAVFTIEESKILEYHEDLYNYYYAGYGREENKKIGCFPFNDMLKHFEDIADNKSLTNPKGVFYFGNDTGLLSFLTAMELLKDQVPLNADNYKDMGNRAWKTSNIAPFTATLYKCKNGTSENYTVHFSLPGHTVKYDWCKDDLCDLQDIRKNLGKVADECKVEACSVKPTSQPTNPTPPPPSSTVPPPSSTGTIPKILYSLNILTVVLVYILH